MRDSWNDTGLEPDPAASADLMWDSPYIWVRTTQDSNLEHVHEHQNPVAGSTNWIYVKLHNGFSTITEGQLELQWSPAATSSQWPAGWNPLPPVPVTNFLAHTTRIVEVQWDGLPGPGLYCMAAHWNSPDDPTTVLATSNMEPQVRRNNNLVWKNLTIMSLTSLLDSNSFSFDVIPPLDQVWHVGQSTTITIRPPVTATKSFTSLGRVVVRLDDRLQNAWERGGSESSGLEPVADGLLINDSTGAVLRNILFTTPARARMTLEFSRRTKILPGIYRIDVTQVSKNKGVGGLSFEIRVPRE
jgi:hypothetical protein